jgi:hypothetical protein
MPLSYAMQDFGYLDFGMSAPRREHGGRYRDVSRTLSNEVFNRFLYGGSAEFVKRQRKESAIKERPQDGAHRFQPSLIRVGDGCPWPSTDGLIQFLLLGRWGHAGSAPVGFKTLEFAHEFRRAILCDPTVAD